MRAITTMLRLNRSDQTANAANSANRNPATITCCNPANSDPPGTNLINNSA